MSPDEAYQELITRSREDALLASCANLLEWDQETYMPPGSVNGRGDQLAFLAGQLHGRATDPRVGELLATIEGTQLTADPTSPSAVNVRETRRTYDRETKIPRALAETLARTTAHAQQAWAAARAENDFPRFRPWLEKVITLKREEATCVAANGTPLYDALLDEYEPGARGDDVQTLYDAIRAELVPLIDAITGAARQPSATLLDKTFPSDRQRLLVDTLATAVGFDFRRGRLDKSVHPFCARVGPSDVRLTARYDPRNIEESIFGVLHEVGHGLYDQGLDPDAYGTPMGEAVSLGIHESQSRLWENRVGRGRAFWTYAFPLARDHFPDVLGDATPDSVYFAVNRVARTPIRTRADEVTYNLHTLIRFELERALISGNLRPADVPSGWNDAYHRYLNLTPATDTEGCLQDTHWSMGLIGYFPTYTLGDIYSAQFIEAANRAVGPLDAQFTRGDFTALLAWLRTNVHAQGQRFHAANLVEHATGAKPDHRPLINWLRTKYTELYQL
jgi:carboxypeptidase Taq